MKLITSSLVVLALLLVVIPPASGMSLLKPGSNSLENTELHGQSAVITLDIKFGADEHQPLFSRTVVHPQIESMFLSFYGDEITLSEPELRVVGDGRHFRISSIPDGILIYGHQNKDLENYKINVLLVTDKGFSKFPVTTVVPIVTHREDNSVDVVQKRNTIIFDNPTLHVLTDHYERVLTETFFRFEVKTFDKNMYDGDTWDTFYGKLDGVKVDARIIDSYGIVKKEFSGYTKYGIFGGEQLVKDTPWPSGNYRLELDLAYENQTYSKNLDFMVLEDSWSYNNRPITDAGDDQHLPSGGLATLSGSESADQDDSTIFYTWTQTSGTSVTLSDIKSENPTFTIPDVFGTFIFNLSVDDGRKATSITDDVTITSLHSDAGPDQDTGIELVTLDGSGSGDALSHSITYAWSVTTFPDTSGITTGSLSDTSIVNPTFTPDLIGNYTLQLVVDDTIITDTDTVTITVTS